MSILDILLGKSTSRFESLAQKQKTSKQSAGVLYYNY